jgi:hypothetical protein
MRHFHLCISVQKTDDRQRDEYTCYAWAGGKFFQLCCCVSFLVVAEIVLGDTYLPHQLCRCVFVLLQREFLVAQVSFLVVAGVGLGNLRFLQVNPGWAG